MHDTATAAVLRQSGARALGQSVDAPRALDQRCARRGEATSPWRSLGHRWKRVENERAPVWRSLPVCPFLIIGSNSPPSATTKRRRNVMARLRHFAIVVRDFEKAAQFYEKVFDLRRVGRDDLEFGSGIYLSDGVINLALLKYKGKEGSGLDNASAFVGAHHFGFQVDDLNDAQRRIEAAGGKFFFDLGKDAEKENFERKFKDPDGIIFDISQKGWAGTER